MKVKLIEEIIKDGNSFIKKYSIIYNQPLSLNTRGEYVFNKKSFYKR